MDSLKLSVFSLMAMCIVALTIKAPDISKIWFLGGLIMGALAFAIANILNQGDR